MVIVNAADPWGRPKENFVNWENPHVNPIHITPNGSTLVAVNTPDNSLMVFDINSGDPQLRATIPVGLEPVSVRARTNNEVWVVNHVSDTISIVNLSQGKVTATLKTSDEPADVVFAGSPQKAFVSASQANQLNVFDPSNHGAAPQIIFINGEDPRALAVSNDGSEVYVAIFESGNGTTVVTGGKQNNWEVDLVRRPEGPYGGLGIPPNKGEEYDPPLNPNVPAPVALSMIVRKDDQGRWMDDNNGDWSRLISGDLSGLSGTRGGGRVQGWDLPDRDVAIVNANTLAVSYQTRLMNANMALGVNPSSGEVTVVGTDATNEIRWEPNLNGTFLRVNLASFTPGGSNKITDLNPHLDYSTPTVAQSIRNQSIGDPRGIAWNSNGTRAYITGMGSNNVIVVNNSGDRVGRIEVGEGPTGIAINGASSRAYVINKFDASISTINLSNNTEVNRLAFFDPTPDAIKKGRPHLYDTHATSGLGHISCASCHIDGRTDRLAWDLGNPAGAPTPLKGFARDGVTVVEAEQPPLKGPLLTMTLQDIIGHPSMHWSGDKPDLGHFAEAFVSLQGDDAPLDNQSTAEFETFLDSVHIPGNPYRQLDNNYASAVSVPGPNGTVDRVGNAATGRQTFENSCRDCHPGNSGRGNLLRFNGGFGLGIALRPPTWRNFHERFGLWFDDATGSNSGFGFQQDGSFDSRHNGSRSADLMAFMLSFNGRFPGEAEGLDEGNQSKDTHAAVGTQVAVEGSVSSTDNSLISQLLSMADDESIGVAVKGRVGGESRGYAYLRNNRFQSDREDETLTSAQLLALAENSGNNLIYTAVPAGSEIRIGIDKDMDGEYDRDERDLVSNANDPTQTAGPQQCASTNNVAGLGTASQSSTFGGNRFPANLAIDGNLENFSHTATGDSLANWSLALDQNYLIRSIVLHNRSSATSRLRDITVYVEDGTGEQVYFKSHFQNRHNRNDGPVSITLDLTEITGAPVEGRNIRIVRTPDPLLLSTDGAGNTDESDILSLAEVEVLACVEEVINTSQPPVGVPDNVTVTSSAAVTINPLANDTGSNLTLVAPNAFSLRGGSVELVNNNLRYTPKAGFNGEDKIWYTLQDNQGRTSWGEITINVSGNSGNTNAPPVGNPDSVSVTSSATVTIDPLANDTGSNLTLIAPNAYSLRGGNVELSNNTLRYTPKVGFNGEDKIWYTMQDGQGRTSWGEITITVSGNGGNTNTPPVGNPDFVSATSSGTVTIDPLANDTGSNLSLIAPNIYSLRGGNVALLNNTLRYTPKPGFIGEDKIWYTMQDNQGRSSWGEITINVTN